MTHLGQAALRGDVGLRLFKIAIALVVVLSPVLLFEKFDWAQPSTGFLAWLVPALLLTFVGKLCLLQVRLGSGYLKACLVLDGLILVASRIQADSVLWLLMLEGCVLWAYFAHLGRAAEHQGMLAKCKFIAIGALAMVVLPAVTAGTHFVLTTSNDCTNPSPAHSQWVLTLGSIAWLVSALYTVAQSWQLLGYAAEAFRIHDARQGKDNAPSPAA